MSRVIKFRCWNPTGQCMHDWKELVEKNKIHLLAQNSGSYPIMQFTGLLDANGVEIYEGDILKDSSIAKDRYDSGEFVYGVIEFVKSGFCEVYRHPDSRVHNEDIDGIHYVIVGNIYQNPELLK